MGGKASRRVARNARRSLNTKVEQAMREAAQKVQLAGANRARHRDMLTLAQEALTLAQQVPTVELPADHDPADGDPNLVRAADIAECEEKVTTARERLFASTLDLYDILASVDEAADGPDIQIVPANAVPQIRT